MYKLVPGVHVCNHLFVLKRHTQGCPRSVGSVSGKARYLGFQGEFEGRSPSPARFYHLYLGWFGRYDFYVGSVGIAADPILKNTLEVVSKDELVKKRAVEQYPSRLAR